VAPQATLAFDTQAALADPYPLYRMLRTTAPVHWEPTEEAWLLTRYDDVVAALKEPSLSAAADMHFMDSLPEPIQARGCPLRRHFGSWMVFSDPPVHTRLRTLTQDYLTRRAVARARDAVASTAEVLLDRAEALGGLDVLGDYAIPLALVALTTTIGLSERELAQATTWSEALLEFINTEPSVDQTVRSLQALEELTAFVNDLRRGEPSGPPTLASTLIRAQADGTLSKEEVVATFAQNITGALGPIPHLVTNGLAALLDHRDELDRLRASPSFAPLAVKELLRFDSPFLLVPRTVTSTYRVRGVEMQPGQRVAMMLGAANHDPDVFDEPERIDIRRSPNRHIAFGLGTHFCLGAHLTRLVGEVALLAFVSRFGQIEPRGPIERVPLFGMRRLKALYVTVAR
jgi:pimeloyl-[acyl-carrier protein] synthase